MFRFIKGLKIEKIKLDSEKGFKDNLNNIVIETKRK